MLTAIPLFQASKTGRYQTLDPSYHRNGFHLRRRSTQICTSSEKQGNELLTVEAVSRIAHSRGLHISVKELGPLYTIECKDRNKDGALLGTTSGFTVPLTRLMHCDSMQVYTRGKGDEGGKYQRGLYGIGYLLATAVFALGYWKGFRKAEILAINDNDYAHDRLIKYYTRLFGFKAVREVGGGRISDIPHLLVWGGVGTRMDGNLEVMLRRCSRTYSGQTSK